jgi:hypothetical protein
LAVSYVLSLSLSLLPFFTVVAPAKKIVVMISHAQVAGWTYGSLMALLCVEDVVVAQLTVAKSGK